MHPSICHLAGPPSWLLAYRLLAFVYALAIGASQLARIGPRLFVFFTVWNWWFLTVYFGIASLLSLRAVLHQRRPGVGPDDEPAGALGKVLVVMYHVESPVRERPCKGSAGCGGNY